MLPELHIPVFNRLDEYCCSPWAMEPGAFRALWEVVARMDLAAHMAQEQPPLKSQMEVLQAAGGRSIAFIPVLGTMMKQRSSMGGTSTVQLRRDLRQAANDPGVSAILLGVESPGGTTAGMDDLATEVRNAKKSKPVWAHIDDLCASAAYWMASQADRIFANSPTALVGSIGTMLTVYDLSGAAEKEGVKALLFSTGPLKGAGTRGTKVTEEQAADFQRQVDGVQVHFDDAVRKGRGLTKSQLETVRTGGVWKATDAQARGLIDGVQPLQKTVEQLAAAAAEPRGRRSAAMLPMLGRTLPMLPM